MCDDVSEALDRAPFRCILPERNMRTRLIVVGEELRKNSPQVLFVEHDQMIGTLASDRPDQAFNMAVLPRRVKRGRLVANAHRSHACFKRTAKCSVIVADNICRCAVPRECFSNLACQPLGGRISGNRKPQQLRRPWPRTRNAKSCSKAIVGTTKRSIDAMPSA
jgi:hypothetical protein